MLEGARQVLDHVSVAESDLEPLKAASLTVCSSKSDSGSVSAHLSFAKCPAASSDVSSG